MSELGITNYKIFSNSISAFENINFGKILLYSFAVSMYLPMIFTNIISITLVLYCFNKFNRVDFKTVFKDKFVMLFLLFIVMLTLGFFYDIPKEGVFKGIEKKLSFALLPICIGLIGIKKKDIQLILLLFFYSGMLVTTIAVFKTFLLSPNLLEFNDFVNHKLSNKVNLHATYLSMYLLLSLVYPMIFLKSFKNKVFKLFVSCLSLLCVVYVLLLGVRIIWITLFLLIIIKCIFIIKEFDFFKKRNYVTFMVLILTCSLVFIINPLRERIKEMVNYNNEYNVKEVWGGRGIRIMIWESGWQLLKQNPISGYGSSTEVQTQLDNTYKENNLGPLLFMMEKNNKKFNPHNQFLSEFLKHGIFLGFFYPFALFFLGKEYYTKRSIFGFYFLIIILMASLTETILELNKGIVFFTFFASVLHYSLEQNHKDTSVVGLNK